MPTFKELYNRLDREEKGELNKKLIFILDSEYSTFHEKKRKNSWNKLECLKISEYLKYPVDVLFPDIFKNNWLDQPELSEKLKEKIFL